MTRADLLRDRRAGRVLPLVVVVVLVLVGAVAGLTVAAGRETEYEARALLAADAQSPSLSAAGGSSASAQASTSLAAASAAAVGRPDVIARARLQSPGGAGRPEVRVRGSVLPGTAVTAITATSTDRAAALAESRAFALAIRRLQIDEDRGRFSRAADTLEADAGASAGGRIPAAVAAQIARLRSSARSALPLSLVRVDEVTENEPSPPGAVVGLIGAAIGLLVAIALLVGARLWRGRGRRIVDLPALRKDSAAVLGALPPLRAFSGRDQPFALTRNERELFRIVRRGVRDIAGGEPQVVLVTSAQPAAGKSSTAVGLASAAAESGQRVLLVECDLRIPSQAARLGLAAGPGLAEYLAGTVEPRSALQRATCPHPRGEQAGRPEAEFFVVTAGRNHGLVELDGPALDQMLSHVRSGYDLVVLDAPPLLGAVDSGDLVGRADVVVVCARLGRITRSALRSAVAVAERGGGEHVGIVATGVRPTQDPARETEVYGAVGD